MNLDELAVQLHGMAVEKGFWAVEDAEAKHLAKMHSELSEALQEDRCGRPMLYADDIAVMGRITDPELFDGRKPEGIAAELADLVMMALDWTAQKRFSVRSVIAPRWDVYHSDMYGVYRRMHLPQLVLNLHGAVYRLTNPENFGEVGDALLDIILGAELWLHIRGIDLGKVITLKMEYNRSRPALHGRKY